MDGQHPRIGNGLDVHAFSDDPDRPLVLGGVTIPGSPGLEGHSDADVVLHAVCDALLGAAALGDLGSVFGTDDPDLAGASSLDLLAAVLDRLRSVGGRPHNVDCTVVASRPRLAEHLGQMRTRVAATLDIDEAQVSVKATSTDGVGAIGRGEGIACLVTVLVVGV